MNLLYKAIEKCRFKTTVRALGSRCAFNCIKEMGRDNFGCLNSLFSLFLFCDESAKKELWCTYAYS